MKEWYAAKELAGLTGVPGTIMSVIRRAKSEQWRFQDVPAPGGPGGKRREYHLSSIPEETRIALLEREAGIVAMDETAFREYLSARKISLTPAELADPVWQAKIACAQAFGNLPAYKGRERLLETLAAKYGKSKQQIRRWVDDVEALHVRTTHRIRLGDERVELPDSSAFSPEALACGLAAYANDIKAGVKAAYREIEKRRGSRGQPLTLTGDNMSKVNGQTPELWRMGDYVSFTRIVKKIPDSVWLRIRKGATGFELHGLPKIIRQWTAVPVQSVLCGDQKIFDYLTYDPISDNIICPEGYFWMDCSSRMINGCWIELSHYNQFTVGSSLREALRYGIPDEIFTDWGKPEGAKHIGHILSCLSGFSTTGDYAAMNERYSNIASEDAPDHRKAQPGKPWMKPIENIMNIIEQRLTDKRIPGYRKRDTSDPWANKETQDLLKKQARKGRLMNIADFITTVFTAIDEHNRAEKQLKEGGSIVPLDFFSSGLMAAPKPVFDDRTLDYICLPTFERTPRQSIVSVTMRSNDHRTYYSPLLSGRRKRVRISVDPYDRDAPATLTDPDGNFLGLADAWHAQHPQDSTGLSRKIHAQKELMQWVRVQANRLREGFGLIDAAPVAKITSATATARKADDETKIYQLHKFEQKQETARIKSEAIEGQKELAAEFAFLGKQRPEVDPWSLPDGRDKYAYWLKVKGCVELNKPMTDTEQAFYVRYPRTADYRACNGLYEEHGEIYLGGMA